MPGAGAAERKRLRDQERKRKKAEAEGLDPDAKRQEVEFPLPPKLEDESPEEYVQSIKLASAVYEACMDMMDQKCNVSMLGSHYRVHDIKKTDARLKQYRLIEVLKRHPDIFEIGESDQSQSAQWPVKIADGGKECLKILQLKVGVTPLDEEEAQDGLPPFELPTDQLSALQAVRVACARSLKKRGKPTPLQDLCQDGKVLKLKKGFLGDKVVEKVLAMCEQNFSLEDKGHGLKEVTLVSTDMDDTEGLEEMAKREGKENPKWVGEENRKNNKNPPRTGGGGGGGGPPVSKDERWEELAAKGFESFLYMAGMKGWGKGKLPKGKGKGKSTAGTTETSDN